MRWATSLETGKLRGAEHDLQAACVRWFRLTYPDLQKVLFSVPNGGLRHPKVAAAMKKEGQVAGVADLILLIPRYQHGGLCIEMKTPTGRQSKSQKEFEQAVTQHGYAYKIVRSFEEFQAVIQSYLKQ